MVESRFEALDTTRNRKSSTKRSSSWSESRTGLFCGAGGGGGGREGSGGQGQPHSLKLLIPTFPTTR